MTSGNFSYVPVNAIEVSPNRQRQKIEGLEELAESIRRNGLINPIVITRENVLVAGERRLKAHQLLAFDQIAVQYTDQLEQGELEIIELEENVRRADLTWQERVQATAKFHKLKKEMEEEWTYDKTQSALGLSKTVLKKTLFVNNAIEEGVKEVAEAPAFSSAYSYASRRAERRRVESNRELTSDIEDVIKPTTATVAAAAEVRLEERHDPDRPVTILKQDFITWSETPQETPYNFIHCDFPYGINAGSKIGLSGAKSTGGYEDSPEIYYALINALMKNQDNFLAASAHIMFWFSMKYYHETYQLLSSGDWHVQRFPVVWLRSDNSGILPDPQRQPRRIYETAFICVRGDRKLVKPRGNAIAARTTKDYHMSEKPHAVLAHFLPMFIDDSSRVLDPTCGSGMALRVAEENGAVFSLGMDISAEYVDRAKQNLGL